MNVAIVGFDLEGKSSYEYYKDLGANITICDQNESLVLPGGVESKLGDDYLDNLDVFDVIVRTPGLHPAKILSSNPGVSSKITSQVNLFFEQSPTSNIIGVTGTKGKGTTSSLIADMLHGAGKDVHIAGNIGIPALSLLPKLTANSWVVLELSSFQLIDLRRSPHIATVLMVEPEHLDWHEDFEEYLAAKQQLFIHQSDQDIAVYYAQNENSLSIADASEGNSIPYYEAPGAIVDNGRITIDGKVVCDTSELKLLGKHNWQNACAAVTTAYQVTQNIEALKKSLTSFSGLEHRLEFVAEVNGVKYYDDSFGTTPETAIVAFEAFEQPKVVILGGSDKGVAFDKLAEAAAKNNVRAAITIGATGPAIAAALKKQGFTAVFEGGDTMQQIVTAATSHALPGDAVLLSTGCASFGLFKNYKDRGNQFVAAVNSLN